MLFGTTILTSFNNFIYSVLEVWFVRPCSKFDVLHGHAIVAITQSFKLAFLAACAVGLNCTSVLHLLKVL